MYIKTLISVTNVQGDSFDANVRFVREDGTNVTEKSIHIAPGNLTTVEAISQEAKRMADGMQAIDDLNNELKGLLGTEL